MKTVSLEENEGVNIKNTALLLLRQIQKKWKLAKNTSPQYKNGEEVLLIQKQENHDYQIYESRLTTIFENGTPFVWFKSDGEESSTAIPLSINTGSRADSFSQIKIEGGFYDEKEIIENFSITLSKTELQSIERPSYWLELSILLPKKIKADKCRFKAQIEKITTTRIDKKQEKNPHVFLTKHLSTQKDLKPKLIIICSFDGISHEDIDLNEMPGFSAFANNAVSFQNAICSASVTGSASACLISGLGTSRHLIYDYDEWHYSPNLKTLSPQIVDIGSLMRQQGYKTFALTVFSKWRPHYGYARGFDQYINVASGSLQNYKFFQKSLEFIANSRTEPTFVLLHLPGAHPPFKPSFENNSSSLQMSAYLATLKRTDLFLQGLMGWLKEENVYNDSLICLLADHGRSVHPYSREGYQFKEDRLRIPLVVKFPEDSENKNYWQEKTKQYISGTTTAYEILAQETKATLPDYFKKLSQRTYGEISWVNETLDYGKLNKIGIVGYDTKYKWVLYFEFDNQELIIGKLVSIFAFSLNNQGIADDSKQVGDISETDKNRAIASAQSYLFNENDALTPVLQKDLIKNI